MLFPRPLSVWSTWGLRNKSPLRTEWGKLPAGREGCCHCSWATCPVFIPFSLENGVFIYISAHIILYTYTLIISSTEVMFVNATVWVWSFQESIMLGKASSKNKIRNGRTYVFHFDYLFSLKPLSNDEINVKWQTVGSDFSAF